MIHFKKHTLSNGLRVIIHEDASSPMVAVNIVYDVGSRDEDEHKTGFAHLFEHLMFGGSKNAPDFDSPIQNAGGENNAFTNTDMTNFYAVVPAQNIETVLWLESDRMKNLIFSQKALDIQKSVVIEEFKETCLTDPYGDVWHHLSELAYKVHPYRWPTIGKIPQHVENVTMEDVKDFYYKYYRPNNAILVVAGNVGLQQIQDLTKKWFGDIPAGNTPIRQLPIEPPQIKRAERIATSKVPMDALYLGFHSPGRKEKDYYVSDLLSDILCNGNSSRLYQKLYKQERIFTQIDAFVTGNIDPGLLVITGRPAEDVNLKDAEAAVWQELELLKNENISDSELQKYKNKVESALVFSEASILNKAINLAYFELVGDANLINTEADHYQKITVDDIQNLAQKIFIKENSFGLYYKAQS